MVGLAKPYRERVWGMGSGMGSNLAGLLPKQFFCCAAIRIVRVSIEKPVVGYNAHKKTLTTPNGLALVRQHSLFLSNLPKPKRLWALAWHGR